MGKVKIADGQVEIRDHKYQYEFYTDNKDVYVKIHHPGRKGDVTEFIRNDKLGLKNDMDQAMENNGLFQ